MYHHAHPRQNGRPRIVQSKRTVQFTGTGIFLYTVPTADINPGLARMRPDGIFFLCIRLADTGIDHVHVIHESVAIAVVLGKINISSRLNNLYCVIKGDVSQVVSTIVSLRFRKRHRCNNVKRGLELAHRVLDKIIAHAPAHPVFGITFLVHVIIESLLRVRGLEPDIGKLHEHHKHAAFAHRHVAGKGRTGRHGKYAVSCSKRARTKRSCLAERQHGRSRIRLLHFRFFLFQEFPEDILRVSFFQELLFGITAFATLVHADSRRLARFIGIVPETEAVARNKVSLLRNRVMHFFVTDFADHHFGPVRVLHHKRIRIRRHGKTFANKGQGKNQYHGRNLETMHTQTSFLKISFLAWHRSYFFLIIVKYRFQNVKKRVNRELSPQKWSRSTHIRSSMFIRFI